MKKLIELLDQQYPLEAKPANVVPLPSSSGEDSYYRPTIEKLLEQLGGLSQGSRNETGQAICWRIGRLVAGSASDSRWPSYPESEAETRILEAGRAVGLKDREIRASWVGGRAGKSGFRAGLQRPMRREDRDWRELSRELGVQPPELTPEGHDPTTLTERRDRSKVARLLRELGEAREAKQWNAVAELGAELAQLTGVKKTGPRWALTGAADIFAERPPIEWLCKEFAIGIGQPPALFYGAPGSKKTYVAQELALSVALGEPAMGTVQVKQATVLHLDYEQGPDETWDRYLRLARGRGVEQHRLEGRLKTAIYPELQLDEEDAYEALTELVKESGARFIVVDSLRNCALGLDENSSEMARPMKLMARVAAELGVAFLLLSHAGKGGKDKDDRDKNRGSGAIIANSCGAVLFEGAAPDEPTKVKHTRRRRGRPPAGCSVRVVDVSNEDATDDEWGVQVLKIDAAEKPTKSREELLQEEVLRFVREQPDATVRSGRVIVNSVPGRDQELWQAIANLKESGELLSAGGHRLRAVLEPEAKEFDEGFETTLSDPGF